MEIERQKIEKAYDLLKDAQENLKEAKAIFEAAGMIFCDGFSERNADDVLGHPQNMLMYVGLDKLERILGKSAEYRRKYDGTLDKSCKQIEHRGLVFWQLSEGEYEYVYRRAMYE